ncbi:hypothetical protein SAMN02745830_02695 [Streptomyces sp. Amel2xC10]|nr:hypothetical protein SAMN02745830_02695 [Streptomyces sp. Amel2xC10]
MYDVSTRKQALALIAQGRSLNSVSRETGISRSAIRSWQYRLTPLPRMAPPATCISAHPRSGYYLHIACADAWPGLIQECREAITRVHPGTGHSPSPSTAPAGSTSARSRSNRGSRRSSTPTLGSSSRGSSTRTAAASQTGRTGWSAARASTMSTPVLLHQCLRRHPEALHGHPRQTGPWKHTWAPSTEPRKAEDHVRVVLRLLLHAVAIHHPLWPHGAAQPFDSGPSRRTHAPRHPQPCRG